MLSLSSSITNHNAKSNIPATAAATTTGRALMSRGLVTTSAPLSLPPLNLSAPVDSAAEAVASRLVATEGLPPVEGVEEEEEEGEEEPVSDTEPIVMAAVSVTRLGISVAGSTRDMELLPIWACAALLDGTPSVSVTVVKLSAVLVTTWRNPADASARETGDGSGTDDGGSAAPEIAVVRRGSSDASGRGARESGVLAITVVAR